LSSLGLYAHIPFCVRRCAYCDFPTVAGEDVPRGEYLAALAREIAARAGALPPEEREADTLYLGGGTPSLLDGREVRDVVGALRGAFRMSPGAEITLEANPESVERGKAEGWARAGVNRVSLGVQSLRDGELGLLGRAHTAEVARAAWGALRAAGFENLGLDLIAGVPEQTAESFRRTLDEAIALSPEHVSLYLLETDKPTPLTHAVERGDLALPADEDAASMYETALERLEAAGLARYEISNWARPGRESRHNRKYWREEEVLGFGLGAHSLHGGVRLANPREMGPYLEAVGETGDPSRPAGPQGEAARREEGALMGLRLAEGLDRAAFARRFGADPWEIWAAALEGTVEAGLLEVDEGRMRLTRRGLLLANEVFSRILGPDAEV
jgi:oxygen-independent coproporphyrinogen-3 oxidase